MSGKRGYSPNLATTHLLGDLTRALAPVGAKVRLLPPAVGARRVSITIGTETRRATLAEARQIVKDLS